MGFIAGSLYPDQSAGITGAARERAWKARSGRSGKQKRGPALATEMGGDTDGDKGRVRFARNE